MQRTVDSMFKKSMELQKAETWRFAPSDSSDLSIVNSGRAEFYEAVKCDGAAKSWNLEICL